MDRSAHRLTSSIAVLALLLATLALLAPAVSAQGVEIGFGEDFALADDRAVALDQLIPGTPESYYYRCLHAQNEGRLDEVPALLEVWIERYGRGGRVQEIENRQALLAYEDDPAKTFQFLRERLGLHHAHQRQVPGEKTDLASRLDPALVSFSAFDQRARRLHTGTLDGFRDSALEKLAGGELDDRLLRNYLNRLDLPDVPNLPALVVRDLGNERSRGFGSLGIHDDLLLEQLEECFRLRPTLLREAAFVSTYLKRLWPNPDVQWRRVTAEQDAYLERLQAFTNRLAPAHNSLKAHVLHHRLLFDLKQGRLDQGLFLEYLRLPRQAGYVNPKWLEKRTRGEQLVNLGEGFPTELGPIGDDEALVRAYLSHFFVEEESFERYADFVRQEYLERLFAETKILAGTGDMERWYSMLDDPVYYERLEERVEIEFAPTQRTEYAADESVSLAVDLKNVDTLLVKVFEINTLNYYTEEGREVDASINLDGLVANEEQTFNYTQSPLRRVRRSFDFPALAKPGVFIVELIGNGLSSRAVIRKGRLQLIERSGAAGQVLCVFDERGNHLREASVHLGDREYPTDERGEILIPFSTEPGRRPVILRGGGLSTLEELPHRSEEYRLEAGIFIDRESLLAERTARILVRPVLFLNDAPVNLELLEEPVLAIRSTDQDGVSSTLEARELELTASGELVHEIQVPERLDSLWVTLSGRVENLSQGEKQSLSAGSPRGFQLNQIEKTALTACPLLGRNERGYVIDVLGKNGEPRIGEAVRISLAHRDFKDRFEVSLKTDRNGRIELGDLVGIAHLSASGLPGNFGGWTLKDQERTYPRFLRGAVGEVLRVPYQGAATSLSPRIASLLEYRGDDYFADRFDSLTLEGGYLELRDLSPGTYTLALKEAGRSIEVQVTAGPVKDGWVVGRDRLLERGGNAPLHVIAAEVVGDELVVSLASFGDDARVHLFGTRYLPAYDAFEQLRVQGGDLPGEVEVLHSDSSYHSGRDIGDEYRYILERRYAKKFPGNMLRRPELLLNPWALEETGPSFRSAGEEGSEFDERERGRGRGGATSPGPGAAPSPEGAGLFPDLAFLPGPSVLVANLEPDVKGVVRFPLAELGDGQQLHVVAVDGESTVYTSLVRPEKPLVPEDLRLVRALDSTRHFAEQRSLEFVDSGARTTVDDAATASLEIYDSLASVHRLFVTLSGNQDLVEFNFLLRWPALEREEKLELYSKYACHELHFFLREKDPAFFTEVVKPYLANKAHRTFLDRWLLEEDLTAFLDPWAFGRLNAFERILLGRRIRGQGAAVEAHLRELVELTKRDPAALERFFATALKSGALEADTGLHEELKLLRGRVTTGGKTYKGPGDTGPPAPSAGGLSPAGPSTPGPAAPGAPARKSRAGAPAEEAEKADRSIDADLDEIMSRSAGERDKLRDVERRKEVRQQLLFREAAQTRAYVEHNYWHVRIEEQNAELIGESSFWLDYAAAGAGEPFFSTHFPEAVGSFAEMVLALAVLDLPFEAAEHELASEERRLTLGAKSPLILVRKELQEASPAAEHTPILISQNFFRLDDRYLHVENEQRDKFVTDEFLTGVAYGCQVVLTNPSSTPRQLELLLQVPAGALPVQKGFETRGVPVQIGAFGTATFEYHFYFPSAGSFSHYPVHASRGGELIAFADPRVMNVVTEPSTVDTTSWEHVSQSGTEEEVLAFLASTNLQRLDLGRIAWRMRDREFCDQVLAELRGRHVYERLLWSYGLYHGDEQTAREYLRHSDGFLRRCGSYLDTPLVQIDPIERWAYQHIEYSPLFNGRAHRFGKRQEILNRDLAGQYLALLDILAYKPQLDALDWMSVTYYLLLQDRIEEALASFGKVDPEGLPMALQYDYFQAYLDFYTDEHALARGIAEPYREHPVARWRAMFQDVLNQLDEAEGLGVGVSDEEDRTQRQTALAASEPQLELEVEARSVTLAYQNLTACVVNYYEMDIEFLFSTSPFVQQGSGSFAYIRPNRRDVVSLPAGENQHAFELPEEFRSSNVLVEVRGGGVTRRQAYYANSLLVQTIESYGQLKVTHTETGNPLPKVYVKVFARLTGGDVRFHKDGYTDLRGRFDYVSLSGERESVERYSILILSERNGAVIREVAPPVK